MSACPHRRTRARHCRRPPGGRRKKGSSRVSLVRFHPVTNARRMAVSLDPTVLRVNVNLFLRARPRHTRALRVETAVVPVARRRPLSGREDHYQRATVYARRITCARGHGCKARGIMGTSLPSHLGPHSLALHPLFSTLRLTQPCLDAVLSSSLHHGFLLLPSYALVMMADVGCCASHSEPMGPPARLRRLQHCRGCLLYRLLRLPAGPGGAAKQVRHPVRGPHLSLPVVCSCPFGLSA